jgi:hypothetical protein
MNELPGGTLNTSGRGWTTNVGIYLKYLPDIKKSQAEEKSFIEDLT